MRYSSVLLGGGLAWLSLLISTTARGEWVEWVFDPGVEFRYEDNLNRSAWDADQESDNALRAFLSAAFGDAG